MLIDSENLISITEANQNFSKIVKKVDENGKVVILKNNKPKYIVSSFEADIILTDEEKLEVIAKRILKEHHAAFEELAK